MLLAGWTPDDDATLGSTWVYCEQVTPEVVSPSTNIVCCGPLTHILTLVRGFLRRKWARNGFKVRIFLNLES